MPALDLLEITGKLANHRLSPINSLGRFMLIDPVFDSSLNVFTYLLFDRQQKTKQAFYARTHLRAGRVYEVQQRGGREAVSSVLSSVRILLLAKVGLAPIRHSFSHGGKEAGCTTRALLLAS
jgi:hypothetical protein